jgi:hypothetical protein
VEQAFQLASSQAAEQKTGHERPAIPLGYEGLSPFANDAVPVGHRILLELFGFLSRIFAAGVLAQGQLANNLILKATWSQTHPLSL